MTKILLHKHLYEPKGYGILHFNHGLHTLLLIEGKVGVQVGDGGGVPALGTLEGLHQQQAVQLWQRELEGGGGLRSSLPTIVGFHEALK